MSRRFLIILFLFQECPGGIVQEETFKEIYAKFFPHGSKQHILILILHRVCIYRSSILNVKMTFIFLYDFSDSSLYAHHVFHAFDVNKNGAISFRVRLKNCNIHVFQLFYFTELHVWMFLDSTQIFSFRTCQFPYRPFYEVQLMKNYTGLSRCTT